MANEKRLIDANAFKIFLEAVRQDYLEEDTFSSDFAARVIETVQDEYLAKAPTVDAVEVVRCKNCKHCGVLEHNGKRYCKKPMGCLGCTPTEPENFCSYGEREDNG